MSRPSRRSRSLAFAIAATIGAGSLAVAPPSTAAAGALQTIALETVQEGRVTLGELASRSQRKPVTIAGIGPYTMTGTDSRTGDPYTFVTDANYVASTPAYVSESDERTASLTTASSTGVTWASRSGVTELRSNGSCASGNVFDGKTTYCGVFGPQVYSAPFQAGDGQSVAFDWSATRQSDDYEIYAYLVEVAETSPGVYDYGSAASHRLLTYGRGRNQSWITASGEVPHTGTYRFRFVNGTYDGTGGFAVGSVMYVDGVVRVGLSNPITFDQPGDRLIGSGDVTLAATAVAPGGPVTYASITPATCTVSGADVRLVASGTCSIIADHPGDGVDYVPASSVTRSFKILSAATAPSNSGVPLVQGGTTDGSIVTATDGSWGDGGSAVTSSVGTFLSNGSPIPGVTGSSCVLVADPASTLTYRVTKTNSVGTTSATSAARTGFSCDPASAPVFDATTTLDLRVDGAVATGPLASGVPAPTFAVTGTLPDGLSLDPTTGEISGTPTTAGAYDFTVSASNGVGTAVTRRFTGTIDPAGVAPSFVDVTLASMKVGVAYDDGLTASGIPAPTFAVTGTLPAGLTLDPTTGAVTGTPTTAGAYDFTISISNGIGTAVTRRFAGTVAARDVAPTFVDVTLASMKVGVAYDDGLTASGTPAPRFAVTKGDLPAGLRLDASTGAITGTPTTAGPYDVAITISNGVGTAVTRRLFGTVAPRDVAPKLTDVAALETELSTLEVGEAIDVAPKVAGSPAPRFAVSTGALPAGLRLDPATGAITGAPTTSGRYDFTISISNGVGTAITRRFTGTIAPKVGPTPDTSVDIVPPARDGGSPMVLTGGGFKPGSSVDVVIGGTIVETVTADASGKVSVEVSAPVDVEDYDIEIRGVSEDETAVDVKRSVVADFSGRPTVVPDDGGYTPIRQRRVLDTRGAQRLAAGDTYRLGLDEAWGLPAGSDAAVLNVGAVRPSDAGYLTVFGCDAEMPVASVLNYDAGQTVANVVVVDTSTTREICIYSHADVDLIVDLNGAFGGQAVNRIAPIAPRRVVDTRSGAKLVAGDVLEIDLAAHGADVDSAVAALLNVAVARAEGAGYLSVFPCDETPPTTSNVNFRAGRVTANLAFAELSARGSVCVVASVTTHVVVDLDGIVDTGQTTNLVTGALQRLLDTRTTTKAGAGEVIEIDLGGPDGVAGARAAALNVTVTQPTERGYVTVFPCEEGRPEVSNVNYEAGDTIANHVTAVADARGRTCLYTSAEAHVIVDAGGVYI
ncbi:putative Ig domain-containing protein [Ilumatobacter sp.]|uniref:putative Ig domain-containing protein n=1 Tax=Ilumatobacter sp. TaxID=1967498 RepID=UPI003B52F597